MHPTRTFLACLLALLAGVISLPTRPAHAQPAADWTNAYLINQGDTPFEAGGGANDDTVSILDGSGRVITLYRHQTADFSLEAHAYNVRTSGAYSAPKLLTADHPQGWPYQRIEGAALPSGNVLAVYGFFDNNSTYRTSFFSKVWNHETQQWSAEQAIESNGIDFASSVHMFTTSDGIAAIRADRVSGQLYLQRFSEAGGWQSPIELTGRFTAENDYVAGVVLDDDSLLITYQFSDSSDRIAGTRIMADDSYGSEFTLSSTDTTWYTKPGMIARFNGPKSGAVAAHVDNNNDQLYVNYFDQVTGTWSEPHVVVGDYAADSDNRVQVIVDDDNRVHLMVLLEVSTDPSESNSAIALVSSNPNPSSAADWPNAPTDWLTLKDGSEEGEASTMASVSQGDRGVFVFSTKEITNPPLRRIFLVPVPPTGGPGESILISELTASQLQPPQPFGLVLDRQGRPTINWTYRLNPNLPMFVAGADFFASVVPPLPTEEEEKVADPVCEQPLQVTLEPMSLSLQAGQTADVTVTAINPCNDRTHDHSDVLLSLPAGVTAVTAPEWVVNLTQRVAWQNISLRPSQQQSFTVTIAAGEAAVAGPLTAEVYWRGGVANSAVGELLLGGPASAPAEPAPAPAPETAAPAPTPALPVTLPNTAGEADYGALWLLLAAAGVTLVGTGVSRLR